MVIADVQELDEPERLSRNYHHQLLGSSDEPNRRGCGASALTRTWWDRRTRFDLFVSQAVVDEAGDGDPKLATRRLALLEGVPVLALSSDVHELAQRLLGAGAVPAKAVVDAVHIAVATLNHMEYLLTWNCAHIANAAVRGKIEITCRMAGLQAPVICTPEQLMEP